MNFILCLLVFVCGLTLSQQGLYENEVTTETGSCFPDMYKFLKEFGAVQTKLEAMETKLKETESQVLVLKEKGKTLETKLKETESQVLVLKEKEAFKVVFSAGIPGDAAAGPFNRPTTLIYTRVTTNVGNAYNQHTGIFVAPVRGMYYFSFFYHAGGEQQATLILLKNNQVVVFSTDHKSSYDGADNGGNAAFVELQQGDEVYVQLGANAHVWLNPYTTTFSGYLLYQV